MRGLAHNACWARKSNGKRSADGGHRIAARPEDPADTSSRQAAAIDLDRSTGHPFGFVEGQPDADGRYVSASASPAVPDRPTVNPAVPSKPSMTPTDVGARSAAPVRSSQATSAVAGSVRVLKSYSNGAFSIQMTIMNLTNQVWTFDIQDSFVSAFGHWGERSPRTVSPGQEVTVTGYTDSPTESLGLSSWSPIPFPTATAPPFRH
jgi:hypothetical protein